jgi:hypothetical protein
LFIVGGIIAVWSVGAYGRVGDWWCIISVLNRMWKTKSLFNAVVMFLLTATQQTNAAFFTHKNSLKCQQVRSFAHLVSRQQGTALVLV